MSLLEPTFIELVEDAVIATAEEAGLLPEQIEDMPAFMANWCRLIKRHDPRLARLDDDEIETLIRKSWEPSSPVLNRGRRRH